MNPRRNLELKAHCPNLPAAHSAAVQFGAVESAVLEQIDTYFHSAHGRLKLREIENQTPETSRAELVAYHRPDNPGVRESEFHLVPIADAASCKAALSATLGVRGIVRKVRTLLLWHNVRIHLDEVETLGNFIEFEAVISPDEDEAISQSRLDQLTRAMQINPDQLVGLSYSDLMGP